MLKSFGQVRAAMLCLGMRTLNSILNTQHAATVWPKPRSIFLPTMLRYVAYKCCDLLAQTWDNSVGVCCAEMLQSLGRGFILHVFSGSLIEVC